MPLSDQTRAAINSLLAENPVVLFMKGNRQQPQCGFSARTAGALDMLLPDYVTIDVLQHPEIRDGIKEYGNWPTIPQLYVNGELVGGCDIVEEMMESGELPEALGITPPPADAPSITLDDKAADAIRRAREGQANMAVHLKIDAAWGHFLSLAPKRGNEIAARAGDVEILMDPWTAQRADGLTMKMAESLTGTSFEFDNPNAPPPIGHMSVADLKERMDRGDELHLIDVRGPEEIATARIESARPWDAEAAAFIETLPRDALLVFHCHKGGRSWSLAERYRLKGYTNVHNLEGGIDAWSVEIDPSVPRY